MKLFADRICEIFVLWKPWFVAVRINRNRAVWNGRRASVKPAGSSKAFKWKCISKLEKVYQKWSNYELAIGRAKKEDLIRIATFLTVIGDEALDVFNAFMCGSDEDKVKMDKVLEHFEHYCPLINMPQLHETRQPLVNFKNWKIHWYLTASCLALLITTWQSVCCESQIWRCIKL